MKRWSRRESLALLAAGAAVSASGPAWPQDAAQLLKDLAKAKGLRFGTAMGAGQGSSEFDDPAYRALVVRECDVLVAENEHKWPFLQPRPGEFTFARADEMVAWAAGENIPFRGHCVVWHHERWLPRWVNEHDFGSSPRAEAERLLREHITMVLTHYRGRIDCWDVINETVEPGTGALRETVFTRAAGYEINDFIFHTARAANPNLEIVYNDYMNWGRGGAAHRNGVLRALEQWRSRGAPIDALGIQAHISVPAADDSETAAQREREWRAFLDEVVGMGLSLHITEFDVNDNNAPADIAARDQAVADHARAYLDVTLSYPQLRDVLMWGLVDRYSWLQNFSPRPDGLEKRVAPFDSTFQSKPLYDAIGGAIRSAPPRTAPPARPPVG